VDCLKFAIFALRNIRLMTFKPTLLLAFALVLTMRISAQHVPLRIMSQTPMTGIEEARRLMFDHYGMMWVGTDQGFRSFDGYNFRTYRSDAYSPGILPNNYVRSMTEDQHDRLWIGTRWTGLF